MSIKTYDPEISGSDPVENGRYVAVEDFEMLRRKGLDLAGFIATIEVCPVCGGRSRCSFECPCIVFLNEYNYDLIDE